MTEPAAAAQSDEELLQEMRDYADRYDARWGAFDEGTDPDLYGLSRLVVTCVDSYDMVSYK